MIPQTTRTKLDYIREFGPAGGEAMYAIAQFEAQGGFAQTKHRKRHKRHKR